MTPGASPPTTGKMTTVTEEGDLPHQMNHGTRNGLQTGSNTGTSDRGWPTRPTQSVLTDHHFTASRPTGQGDLSHVSGNTGGITIPSTWDSNDPNPGSWFDQVQAVPTVAMPIPSSAPAGPSTLDNSPPALVYV